MDEVIVTVAAEEEVAVDATAAAGDVDAVAVEEVRRVLESMSRMKRPSLLYRLRHQHGLLS